MRTGQRLAVPRGGIRPISVTSSAYISATMTALTIATSSNPRRADLRAASARMRRRPHQLRRRHPRQEENLRKITRLSADAGLNGHLLRALGAEDGDGNRPTLRNIIAVDAGGDVVAQPDGFGALGKAALRTRFNQREPAAALPQKVRGARSIRQHRRGAGHEDETWLVKTGRGGLRSDADDVAQRARDLRARE